MIGEALKINNTLTELNLGGGRKIKKRKKEDKIKKNEQ